MNNCIQPTTPEKHNRWSHETIKQHTCQTNMPKVLSLAAHKHKHWSTSYWFSIQQLMPDKHNDVLVVVTPRSPLHAMF